MKANNKVLLNQFKSKIRKIISSYTSQTISFTQFMQLLSFNYIRVYSKSQITKIKNFFDNPNKKCRIQIPLSYLILDCIQECQKKRYYVVKISHEKVYNNLVQIQEKKHNVVRCLQTFVQIMRRLYGSSKNWFKVLGGLTVSITIESAVFMRSLSRILCNTSHTNCAEGLTKLFLKQSFSDKIQWKGFMKVISDYDLMTIPMQTKFDLKNTSTHSVDIKRIIFSYKDQSEQGNEMQVKRKISLNRPTLSAQSRAPSTTKQTIKTTIHQEEFGMIQFPRFFSIAAKPCVLYEKTPNKSMIINTTTPFKQSKFNERFGHRKMKTQPSFFQNNKKDTKIINQISFQSEHKICQTNQNQIAGEQNLKVSTLNESQIQINQPCEQNNQQKINTQQKL